ASPPESGHARAASKCLLRANSVLTRRSKLHRSVALFGEAPRPHSRLRWHSSLDRVSAGTVRDVPCGIRWQPCAYPFLQLCEIAGRHRVERRAYASRDRAGGPVILEIRERPLHHDLAGLE